MNDMNMTIEALLTAYRNGSQTPQSVIEYVIAQAQQFERHNIWIRLLTLDEIQPYLDKLKNQNLDEMPLYGIPFAIKDNIDLAGIATTAGCKEFTYVPERSAFVVDQLIKAGAIPVGKTNMDQFATGLVGVRSPEPWGVCRNAFDEHYISGGSSSGSAVAVALGMVSFSLGTDTAGSGRVPAAFNNIIGLKPSRGLLSMSGVVPACRSLDCVSIFAQTVDDANAVFEQAAVYDAHDDYARPNPFANNHRHYGKIAEAFVFAVPQDDQLEFFGNASAQILFNEAIEKLEQMGGKKLIIDFSPFLQAARLLYEGPWVAERYVAIENMITQQPDALLPVIKTIIGGAENKSAIDAFKAEYEMQHYRRQAKQLLSKVDFLLTPTAGTIYTIEDVLNDPIRLNSNLGYYTNYMNLLDCASIAVPAGFMDNGLPFGITLVQTAMKDRLLLSYANRWQQLMNLPLGKTINRYVTTDRHALSHAEYIPVIVCGAHLEGLALNWQLTERGAVLQKKTKSAAAYRMFVIEGAIQRPGMVRDEQKGKAIDIEIWQVPREEFGSFVAAIPAPLGIGKVETRDGRWLPGFICEGYAVAGAREITQLGGWRQYLDHQ
ncbi:MAG: allophanate hydrolase [Gammaproteobacteria bacterium]|nr:MAG: allophanate hydrolase [Gammaproteobacteria bacterium]